MWACGHSALYFLDNLNHFIKKKNLNKNLACIRKRIKEHVSSPNKRAKLQEEIAMSPTHQLSAHPASSLLKWNFPFHYSNILKHILGKRDA